MENIISSALQTAVTHLEHIQYVKMLFVGFSSAFNTIVPHKLVNNLHILGLETPQCSWFMDFLTNKRQSVRIGDCTLSILFLSATRVCPQPSPLLPVYIWMHPKTPLQHNSQVCGWHHCCASDFRKQWDGLQEASAKRGEEHRDSNPKFKTQGITADLEIHTLCPLHTWRRDGKSGKFQVPPRTPPHPECC